MSKAPRLPPAPGGSPKVGEAISLHQVGQRSHLLQTKPILAGRLPSTVPWVVAAARVSLQAHFTDGEAEAWG